MSEFARGLDPPGPFVVEERSLAVTTGTTGNERVASDLTRA